MYDDIIERLEINYERRIKFLPERLRPVFTNINIDNSRGAIVYGPRGVGKTTFILNKVKNSEKKILYFSADSPLVSSVSLYEFVSSVFSKGFDGVAIDEIHFANKWSQHLKAIFDDYPSKLIWISDSSNIILKNSVVDLSRRFVHIRLPLLSFREYIFLTTGIETNTVNPFENRDELVQLTKEMNVLQAFHAYISAGIRPVFFEGEYSERIKNIVEKSIYYDLPFYLPSFYNNQLALLNAIVGHLIYSPVPTINVSDMCRDWGIGKEKFYNILYVMEKGEIINIVRKTEKKGFSKGSKILLTDPSVYYCYGGNIGSARESFVVMSLKEKYKVLASKDERECDFVAGGYKIEVGGKNKKYKNADFVISDDIDIPYKNRIPIWMLGFIY